MHTQHQRPQQSHHHTFETSQHSLHLSEFSSTGDFSLGDSNTKLNDVTAILKGTATVYETRNRIKIGLIIITIIILELGLEQETLSPKEESNKI